MKITFLDFEQPIAELEAKIEEPRLGQDDSTRDLGDETARPTGKSVRHSECGGHFHA